MNVRQRDRFRDLAVVVACTVPTPGLADMDQANDAAWAMVKTLRGWAHGFHPAPAIRDAYLVALDGGFDRVANPLAMESDP